MYHPAAPGSTAVSEGGAWRYAERSIPTGLHMTGCARAREQLVEEVGHDRLRRCGGGDPGHDRADRGVYNPDRVAPAEGRGPGRCDRFLIH